MARGLETRLRKLERSMGPSLSPLAVIFVGDDGQVAEADAARAAAAGKVLAVQFVTPVRTQQPEPAKQPGA